MKRNASKIQKLPDKTIDSVVALTVSRLVITGNHRLHEEITYAGGYLKDKSYNRERVLGLSITG